MLSRRDVSKLIASIGFSGIFTETFAFDGFPMPAIVDASVDCSAEAIRLREAGVKVVARYYALEKQPGLPSKILTKKEADVILDAGLSLLIAYQYYNGSLASFTPQRGEADANKCLEKMREIGQPTGSTIYFGVDNDWVTRSEMDRIIAYFRSIKGIAGDHFRVGVYGSGFTCMLMKRLGLAENFWIAGLSDGWTGREAAMRSGLWNMYQNILELRVGSIAVDTNIVNPMQPAIGSFHRKSPTSSCELDTSIIDERSHQFYRILKRDSRLLKMPAGNPIKTIVASKIVRLIRNEGNYSVIDIPRQSGKPPRAVFTRGYVKSDVLVEIDKFAS